MPRCCCCCCITTITQTLFSHRSLVSLLSLSQDGGGSIDSKELKDLMASVGQNPTDDELAEMIRIADADGTGAPPRRAARPGTPGLARGASRRARPRLAFPNAPQATSTSPSLSR